MEDDGAAAAAGEQPQPVVRAILYGNTATELTDEERTDQASHRWTVYLRPAAHPDVSYIKRVTFQLHKSFRSPRRGQLGWHAPAAETGGMLLTTICSP